MKITKLLAALLALVMVVGIFASCSSKPKPAETFADYFITEFKADKENVVTAMAADASLAGYTVDSVKSNNGLILLSKEEVNAIDPSTPLYSYKLVSLYTGTVLASLTDTYTEISGGSYNGTGYDYISYTVELYDRSSTYSDNFYLYQVTKTTNKYIPSSGTVDTPDFTKAQYINRAVSSLYDSNGNALFENRGNDWDGTFRAIGEDLILIEGKIYELDADKGTLKYKYNAPATYDASLELSAEKNDTNMYIRVGDTICVYDDKVELAATWTMPANVVGLTWYVLNDGNIFIQYSKELAPDENKYDYYRYVNQSNSTDIMKYDLVSEIFNITEKTSKFVELDYEVSYGYSYTTAKNDKGMDDIFAEGFENLVVVAPIVDKRISDSEEDIDILTMTNKGKLGVSLKLVEGQTNIPELIANDRFKVETVYGHAIVDSKGTVIKKLSGSTALNGAVKFGDNYHVTAYGIYDASYELVYDFAAKNAVPYYGTVSSSIFGNTLFIREYNADGDYKVVGFTVDGQTVDMGYSSTDYKDFSIISDLGVYEIRDYSGDTDVYKYYNSDGKELLSLDKAVSAMDEWTGANAALILTADGEYYIIKK